MTPPRRFALLTIAILFAHTAPAKAHITKECLISIVKLNLSTDAFRRLNTAWTMGQLLGLTPDELNRIKKQRDIADARKSAALPNLALCCAPGRSRPMSGCDGSLDQNYDRYDTE